MISPNPKSLSADRTIYASGIYTAVYDDGRYREMVRGSPGV